MKKSRVFIQLLFLSIFFGLWALGRIQLWFFIFGVGLVGSLGVGRVYCGWICPMNTVMKGMTALKKRFKIASVPIPKVFEKPWVRGVLLVLLLGAFLSSKLLGVKLPMLPIIFMAALVVTLIYPEQLWHRFLCPYGTILTLPSKWSKQAVRIDSVKCNNCGICAKVCPSNAAKKELISHLIDKRECLSCGLCEDKCKTKAIVFK